MKSHLNQRLYRSSLPVIGSGGRGALDDAINQGRGVLRGFPRFVSRKFCGAGLNLRLHPDDYHPEGADGPNTDERWLFYSIDADTGNAQRYPAFFREGRAHIHTPDGDLLAFDEAVQEAGSLILGEAHVKEHGNRVKVADKYFDNSGELGHHVHPFKDEAYYFDRDMNGRYNLTQYTSCGFFPWVTPDLVAERLAHWDDERGGKRLDNGVRGMGPGLPIVMNTGFRMPNRLPHGPAAVCTREPQLDLDDYEFLQNVTSDGPLGIELLHRHIPAERHRDWDFIARAHVDYDLARDPNFIANHMCLPIRISGTSIEGNTEDWVIWGQIRGKQLFSSRRIVIPPGGRMLLKDPAFSIAHFTNGSGRINHLPVAALVDGQHRIGEEAHDEFFLTHASTRDGVLIENTGDDELRMTRTFGPDAWTDMPTSWAAAV